MQEHATIDAHDACLGLCWNVPQLVDPHDVLVLMMELMLMMLACLRLHQPLKRKPLCDPSPQPPNNGSSQALPTKSGHLNFNRKP